MKKRRIPWFWLGLIAIVALGVTFSRISNTRRFTQPPAIEDRVSAVSRLWQAARDYYCYFDEFGIDWDGAYYETLNKVLAAEDLRAYIRALEEFRALLCDGHGDGQIFVSAIHDQAYFPFYTGYFGGAFVVTGTADTGIGLGDALVAIEGQDAKEWLEREIGPVVSLRTPLARENTLAQRFMFYYPSGTGLDCTFMDGQGQTYTVHVEAGRYRRMEQLYPISGVEEETLLEQDAFSVTRLKDDILYVRNNTMLELSYWDDFCEDVLPLLAEAKGVILDLRSSSGGNSAIGTQMLKAISGKPEPESSSEQHFYSLRFSSDMTYSGLLTGPWADQFQKLYQALGIDTQGMISRGQTMRQGGIRVTNEQYHDMLAQLGMSSFWDVEIDPAFEIPPDLPPHPMIVLIGPNAGSAVDTTAQYAKDMGIPTLGTRTRGATGDIFLVELGNGIETAFSSHYIYNQATQTPVNNYGIEAEIYLDYTLEDIRHNIDTQLLEAWRLLTA